MAQLFLSFNFIFNVKFILTQSLNFGGYSLGATPLPIPNREVKTQHADGTACAGVWESRSLPNFIYNPGHFFGRGFLF